MNANPSTKESPMYRLVAQTTNPLQQRVALDEYSTYDEAIAAYLAVDARREEYPLVKHYAVRSASDPAWGSLPLLGANPHVWDHRDAYRAVRDWRREEIGSTARAMIAKAPLGAWLTDVELAVARSLAARQIEASRLEISDAVKARVILGRCRPERYHNWGPTRHRREQQGFWLKKSDGPLHTVRCPHCSRRLSQTTLAFQGGFRRLAPLSAPVTVAV